MVWKYLSIAFIVIALSVGGVWVAHGTNIYTKDKVPVITKDEMFGTESTEWKPEFHLGLEFAGPIMAASLIITFFSFRKYKKSLLK
ncbi:MAG: hypothetical protein NT007_12860 [Candidatus Kapabacteria bacterium]|nr:hypothetical protein [Candidatus Kapabacteria bacterium]